MTVLPSPTHRLVGAMQRRLDAASVEGGLGIRVISAGDGRVALEMPLPASLTDGSRPAAAAFESALAVLCDCGLGLALMERRGDGDGGITLDLRVDAVEEVRPGTPLLTLVAEGLHVGDEHGAGRVEVRDPRGRLIAHASGTMACSPSLPVMPRDPDAPAQPALDLQSLFDGIELGDEVARVPIRPETENTRGIVHGALLVAAALAVAREAGQRGGG